MDWFLLTLAIFSIPELESDKQHAYARDEPRRFTIADPVLVVFTQHGKSVSQLTTNVTDILPNGDLKIYGERFTSVGRATWKCTLSGRIRPIDIGTDGTTHEKSLSDLSIRKQRSDAGRNSTTAAYAFPVLVILLVFMTFRRLVPRSSIGN